MLGNPSQLTPSFVAGGGGEPCGSRIWIDNSRLFSYPPTTTKMMSDAVTSQSVLFTMLLSYLRSMKSHFIRAMLSKQQLLYTSGSISSYCEEHVVQFCEYIHAACLLQHPSYSIQPCVEPPCRPTFRWFIIMKW